MKKYVLFLIFFLVGFPRMTHAFWMWTPETNKWVNPKFAVKETPQEQLQYALEFYQAKDYKKTRLEMQKLINHYPKAREAAEAQFYIGLCYEAEGRIVDAFKSYQIVIERYPFSERSAQIVERQFNIGTQLLEGGSRRNKFVTAVTGGDYDVIEIFRTVIKNAPYGKFAAPAQYKIGLYLQEKGLYQEARDEFEKTMNDYPDTSWAKAAKYQIALSDAKRSSSAEYDQKVTEIAIAELKAFVKENPEAELSKEARNHIQDLREKEAEKNFIVAQFYEKQKKYEAAKIYYTTIVKQYNNTTWAQKALKKIQDLNTTNP